MKLPPVIRILLFPVSIIYGTVVLFRNFLYDHGILKSSYGATPTIVIGNLSLGGTGKTPHTEYIIDKLNSRFKVALLSRGYGRKTKGFLQITPISAASQVGDEPLQISQKFPHIVAAVCENRLLGITKLKQENPSLQFVILDDAYQHRQLKPNISILLTDYNHPFWKDCILPSGHLRDNKSAKKRADYIIVTKCPSQLPDLEKLEVIKKVNPEKNQKVFFSTISYGKPILLAGHATNLQSDSKVIGFSGIANPFKFKEYLQQNHNLARFLSFPDHHIFSQANLGALHEECNTFAAQSKIWITTEKDATRLKEMELPPDVSIFYIPIKIELLNNTEETFINDLVDSLSISNKV